MNLGADFEKTLVMLRRAGHEVEIDEEEQSYLKFEAQTSGQLIVLYFASDGSLLYGDTE